MEIHQALEYAGGPAALARVCGVTPAAVSHWIKAGRIPHMRVFQLKLARPEWFSSRRSRGLQEGFGAACGQ